MFQRLMLVVTAAAPLLSASLALADDAAPSTAPSDTAAPKKAKKAHKSKKTKEAAAPAAGEAKPADAPANNP